MISKAVIIGLSFAVLSGCASIQTFDPAAGENQVCEYGAGVTACKSKHANTTVMISINQPKQGYMPVLLLIANESSETLNIVPTEIEITCKNDKDSYSTPLKVYGAREFENIINAKQVREKGALAAGQAVRRDSEANIGNPEDYSRVYKEKIALSDIQAKDSAVFMGDLLIGGILKAGQYVYGTVWADFRQADTYTVTYKILDEVHKIEFKRTSSRK